MEFKISQRKSEIRYVQFPEVIDGMIERLELFFENEEFRVAGTALQPKVFRIEVPIASLDALSWLQRQSHAHKIYWLDREKALEVAGVGEADTLECQEKLNYAALFSRLRSRLSEDLPHLKYYGGIRFDPAQQADGVWKPFASYCFRIPRFEIYQERGESFFACNFKVFPDASPTDQLNSILMELNRVNVEFAPSVPEFPALERREDDPDPSGWYHNIKVALDAFSRCEMKKVVLARKSTFIFSSTLDPIILLRRLKRANPESFHFYFQPEHGVAFIGGSPERLYRREGYMLHSEAIAGTRPRGKTTEEDKRLGEVLLNCEKDVREHWFVVEAIKKAFTQLCKTVIMDNEVTLLKLARVQHLFTGFRGVLKENISDKDVIALLHPTPAVGGYPTAGAIQKIKELETFDRGWYAGPVGWVGPDAAEFAVAIRSGLIRQNRLHLFSGAGIVQGSNPRAEWEEIENKISNFMRVIHSQ